MIPTSLTPVANHLWQSTAFAVVAGLLTLILRKNSARVRHGVWLVASIKFLVPLAVLVALGGQIRWRAPEQTVPSGFRLAMGQVSQPFALSSTSTPGPLSRSTDALPIVLAGVWLCGFVGISISWWRRWRGIRVAVRAGRAVRPDLPVKAISTAAPTEPGVFGVFRPVLLLPDGIHDRLTSAQLQAVIAHELCHVRYRDNLVAAFHMFVETAFWFCPLVWWIGKRMVEERERACDEDVLRRGSEPRAYAEGILNVCKLYVESPVACVSGITGPDLRRRVERIMRPGEIRRLSPGHGLLLSVAAIGAIAIPVGIGMAGAPAVRAQAKQEPPIAFEVASVKGSDAADRRMYVDPPGGGRLTARNVALGWLVQFAYKIEWNQISGGPGWLNTARFDIAARAEDATASEDRIRLMARTLLSDRFRLRLHAESRELPVYLLVQAKAGTKEPRSLHAAGPCPERGPGAGPECQVFNLSPGGHLSAQRATMAQLARVLTDLTFRPVRDQTGIQGEYDFQLSWSPDDATPGAGNSGSAAPDLSQGSIFTALQEQLGLKLQSEKGPVDVFVIDHAEKPSEN